MAATNARPLRPRALPSGTGRLGFAVAACLAWGWLTSGWAVSTETGSPSGTAVRYNTHIRPIFAEHCLACHGPDGKQRKADLRLDVEDIAKQSAIVPGDPDTSELIRRITTDDPDDRMPPPDAANSLGADQVEQLRRWIADGAPYETHWAFEPIRDPSPPRVNLASGSDAHPWTDIDRFLLAELNGRGLTLSPPITRQQWIRRATFDLIGVPPTWDEVQAFERDASPGAYERVIDRLLESPRYGERWGRHWLDIARYADTYGGSAIGFKRFAFSYTYRDYVIRAFNDDLPYDEFIRQQVAADQMDLTSGHPALAGLGFLTVGQQFRNPHDTIDDQIDVVTRGLLGLTVACARCHDHKYDAIPTTDYYALYAAFASSDSPDPLPVVGAPASPEALAEYERELQHRQQRYDDMAREQSVIMRGRLRMQVGTYLRELAQGTPEQDLAAAFLSFRTDDLRPHVLEDWRTYLASLSVDDPVFGPWKRLLAIGQANGEFRSACRELIDALKQENGDPVDAKAWAKLGTPAPQWNPRVLDAIAEKGPGSAMDVADAYGDLFAAVHQEWLRAQVDAAQEALTDQEVIPDEDPRHATVNSAVNRQLRHHLYAPNTPLGLEDERAVRLLNRPIRDHLNGLQGAIHNLHLTHAGAPPRAMALKEDPASTEFVVFRRGSPIDRGEPIQARFLTALSDPRSPHPFTPGKRRLELAEAIVDPENPLTRRVIVNWVWRHHFGRGLVRTPDDFGTRGRPPTHPELLDHLASALLRDDWSMKRLHKRIMLSAAYAQAAREDPAARRKDPDNESLWRMPRRRLEMESMRDAMLAVSGELDTTMYGRPFDLETDPITARRTVYAFINRDIIAPLASTFDAANPSACTAKRPETQVPQQTLFALNSTFIQDRAAALVQREEFQACTSDPERVRWLFQQAFARLPDPGEIRLAQKFLESNDAASADTAWPRLAHALLASNEFLFID